MEPGVQDEPLTILIADDTDSDRLILQALLKKDGHQVLAVANGREAVAAFQREQPDLVLLDVMMPELDGIAACREIRALGGNAFLPILFLTSLTDTDSQVACLEAGGDDFITKPYKRAVLQAKLRAFNRARQLHHTVTHQRDQIALHNEHLIQEQTVAKQVFDNVTQRGCLDASNLRHFMSPLAIFNGDVLVAALRPTGSMLVMMGDFTGHGLPAAIGAMPLASIFYGMAAKGFSAQDILREINQKLKQILPVGFFCCASMVDINFRKQRLSVWNGGLPELIIYRDDGAIERVPSRHLPLGVLPNRDFKDQCDFYEMAVGDRLFLWSDGILEALNPAGEMYGEQRLLNVFAEADDPGHLFDRILADVQGFIGDAGRDDDLSLAEVVMVPPDAVHSETPLHASADAHGPLSWAFQLEVRAGTFSQYNPLPLLLSNLMEVPGLRPHNGTLYTIFSELYSNALEHGVLRLDSALKHSPEGFAHYYQLRQQRLDEAAGGWVRFHISIDAQREGGGELLIRVSDSGEGFAHELPADTADAGSDAYCGRGIALLRNLCKQVRYLPPGNEVEVLFAWEPDH